MYLKEMPRSSPFTPMYGGNQNNGTRLDEVVGRTRLGLRYDDTMQAFTAVVEAGKLIERGQHPPREQFELLIPELNDLRLTAVHLRKKIEDGKYPRLRTAIPHIERYVAMAMQYAQKKGYLPTSNNEAYILRQMRQWLGMRRKDPKAQQVLGWLGNT